MAWLARLAARVFGAVPAEEGVGIGLHSPEYWLLTRKAKFDVYAFLGRLGEFVPEDAVVYLEGTCMAEAVRSYLAERPAENTTQVMTGTYWPKPATYHMQATRDNIAGLAEIAGGCAEPEICEHIVVYQGEDVLLEWWDVPGGAILLDQATPESTLAALCDILQCEREYMVESEN